MDYFKSLITSYQEMNNIPTNTVRIVKLKDSIYYRQLITTLAR